jgi:ribosomal protein S18 acetylase RimI-like enzyme
VTPDLHIREFQFPDDYQVIYDLWCSMEKGVHVGRSDTAAEIEKKLRRDPDLFLVAESNHKIIGSVIGGYDGRRGFIYHLAVHTTFRGQGIGSQLMAEVESRLRARGCLKCYLLVIEDNEEAESYYRNRGWFLMDTVRIFGKELQ